MTHLSRVPLCGRWRVALASGAALTFALAVPICAEAQIKQPGAHPDYSVELEPHATLWWQDHDLGYGDHGTGLGLGLRASIPLVDNGFVKTINNNVALGFGFDWGHYSHNCWWGRNRAFYGDCTNNVYWFPVVMQWNFFITKAFSVFGEPGLAIRHYRWSWPTGYCGPTPNTPCDDTYTDTTLDPVFFMGGRVGNDKVTFTFRVGWPYASLGASFFL
ncbi:MAG: hypothetical protein HY898_18335 [Deltaproteobacteria bacterium]|nr:hypothetical protein [Deltaproteobacteria bacterium]